MQKKILLYRFIYFLYLVLIDIMACISFRSNAFDFRIIKIPDRQSNEVLDEKKPNLYFWKSKC